MYQLQVREEQLSVKKQSVYHHNFPRDYSTWFISSNGIKVTVEDAKCVQSNAFVMSELFQEFNLEPGRGDEDGTDDLSFTINLKVVLECLNCLSGDGANSGPCVKICYSRLDALSRSMAAEKTVRKQSPPHSSFVRSLALS